MGNVRRIKSGEKIQKVMSRCSVQIDVGGMMFKGKVVREVVREVISRGKGGGKKRLRVFPQGGGQG